MANPERGTTRSGGRFAARNTPYYASYEELMTHHKKLLSEQPAITERPARIFGIPDGYLSQTTARFRFDSPIIETSLRAEFNRLFAKYHEDPNNGFEVVVTFNCVLHNQDTGTFSLFYGQDHRASNDFGAAPELKYGTTIIVRSLLDLHKIPTDFNEEQLFTSMRRNFESSNVSIYKITNVIYLIYRYVSTGARSFRQRRREFLDRSGDPPPGSSNKRVRKNEGQ